LQIDVNKGENAGPTGKMDPDGHQKEGVPRSVASRKEGKKKKVAGKKKGVIAEEGITRQFKCRRRKN